MRMTPTGLTLDKIYFRILQMIPMLERLIMSIAKKTEYASTYGDDYITWLV